jgi:hypothetical protein
VSTGHVSQHLPAVPIFFNQEAADLEGFSDSQPAKGSRITGIKSVLYSDGSARRWYRVVERPVKLKKKRKKNSKRKVS